MHQDTSMAEHTETDGISMDSAEEPFDSLLDDHCSTEDSVSFDKLLQHSTARRGTTLTFIRNVRDRRLW